MKQNDYYELLDAIKEHENQLADLSGQIEELREQINNTRH